MPTKFESETTLVTRHQFQICKGIRWNGFCYQFKYGNFSHAASLKRTDNQRLYALNLIPKAQIWFFFFNKFEFGDIKLESGGNPVIFSSRYSYITHQIYLILHTCKITVIPRISSSLIFIVNKCAKPGITLEYRHFEQNYFDSLCHLMPLRDNIPHTLLFAHFLEPIT